MIMPASKQALDESRRRPGLAGACCHLDQQLASSAQNLSRQRLDAIDLVVTIDNLSVGCYAGEVTANLAHGNPPFQVILRIEACNLSGMRVGVAVQEPHFLAV